MVGDADGDVDEESAAGGPHPRHGSLDEVPHAVELVTPLEVRPPSRLPGTSETRVQVPVRGLGSSHSSHEALVPAREIRVSAPSEFPCHRLEQLVDSESTNSMPECCERLARRGGVKVPDPPDSLHPVFAVLQDRVRVPVLPFSPVPTGEPESPERERAQDGGRGQHRAGPGCGRVGEWHGNLRGEEDGTSGVRAVVWVLLRCGPDPKTRPAPAQRTSPWISKVSIVPFRYGSENWDLPR